MFAPWTRSDDGALAQSSQQRGFCRCIMHAYHVCCFQFVHYFIEHSHPPKTNTPEDKQPVLLLSTLFITPLSWLALVNSLLLRCSSSSEKSSLSCEAFFPTLSTFTPKSLPFQPYVNQCVENVLTPAGSTCTGRNFLVVYTVIKKRRHVFMTSASSAKSKPRYRRRPEVSSSAP